MSSNKPNDTSAKPVAETENQRHDEKPREWWIPEDVLMPANARGKLAEYIPEIRVVEHAAYQAVCAERVKARAEIERLKSSIDATRDFHERADIDALRIDRDAYKAAWNTAEQNLEIFRELIQRAKKVLENV